MIIELQGDLLESDCEVIAHGCNCFCNMGAGIAVQIKYKHPMAFNIDFLTKRGDAKKLGTFTAVDLGAVTIYNLYTQYRYGRGKHLDEDALVSALEVMKEDIEAKYDEWPKVGIPRIGCGLAGGDWKLVKPLIEEVFVSKTLYVYSL